MDMSWRSQVCELKYSKATANPARWVLAVPEDSAVQTAADLAGTIVASELVETTKRYCCSQLQEAALAQHRLTPPHSMWRCEAVTAEA